MPIAQIYLIEGREDGKKRALITKVTDAIEQLLMAVETRAFLAMGADLSGWLPGRDGL